MAQEALCLPSEAWRARLSTTGRLITPGPAGSGLPTGQEGLAWSERQVLRLPREPTDCFLCSWEPRGPQENQAQHRQELVVMAACSRLLPLPSPSLESKSTLLINFSSLVIIPDLSSISRCARMLYRYLELLAEAC